MPHESTSRAAMPHLLEGVLQPLAWLAMSSPVYEWTNNTVDPRQIPGLMVKREGVSNREKKGK